MQISDQMVERACAAITEKRGFQWPSSFDGEEQKVGRENMRAALEAALSAQDTGAIAGARVKALEFIELSNVAIAHTPFGTYECGFNIAGPSTHQYQMVIAGCQLAKSFHDTLEAAKAAAQADYSARILAALEPQERDGWKDIDSLEPDDGMIIIGYGEYRERDGFSPAFMRWSKSAGGWFVTGLPFYPTHWMPVPAPPHTEGK